MEKNLSEVILRIIVKNEKFLVEIVKIKVHTPNINLDFLRHEEEVDKYRYYSINDYSTTTLLWRDKSKLITPTSRLVQRVSILVLES